MVWYLIKQKVNFTISKPRLKEKLLVARSKAKDLKIKDSKGIVERKSGREVNDDRMNRYHGKARKGKREGNNSMKGTKQRMQVIFSITFTSC
jgi:hypothetical protein